jgi:Fe-S cluster assembly protein SufD
MYAFSNDALKAVKIPELKAKINKIIAGKLDVNIGFDL